MPPARAIPALVLFPAVVGYEIVLAVDDFADGSVVGALLWLVASGITVRAGLRIWGIVRGR